MTQPTYVTTSNVQMDMYATSGTTDATGAITFTLPAGMFGSVFSVQVQAVRDTVNPTTACFALVRSFSATSVVVQVFESKTNSFGGEGLEKTAAATVVTLAVFGT